MLAFPFPFPARSRRIVDGRRALTTGARHPKTQGSTSLFHPTEIVVVKTKREGISERQGVVEFTGEAFHVDGGLTTVEFLVQLTSKGTKDQPDG